MYCQNEEIKKKMQNIKPFLRQNRLYTTILSRFYSKYLNIFKVDTNRKTGSFILLSFKFTSLKISVEMARLAFFVTL